MLFLARSHLPNLHHYKRSLFLITFDVNVGIVVSFDQPSDNDVNASLENRFHKLYDSQSY